MTDDTIHTCSYSCERPGCIRAQRDELVSRLEALTAAQQRGQAAPPSAPAGVEAVRGAWLAAITLANNICVQESDRENDRDGDTGWIDGTAKCAKRIREYAHPTDAELLEMLDEAGANAAKAALAQQPSAVDEAAAIRAFEEHFEASAEDPYFEGELELWLTAWRKALAAQPGGAE